MAADSPVEALCRIAARLLDVPEVLPSDNFFQLGGDTTAAMRLLLDADSAGLGLRRSQVRHARNMAELASGASAVSRPEGAPSESGPVALGPSPRWFLGWSGDPPLRWNIVTAVTSDEPLDGEVLAAAARAAVSRHDAFRLRLDRDGGAWRARLQDEPRIAVDRIAAARGDDSALRAEADALHQTVDVIGGPLARVLHVDRGPGRADVVLVCASHLVSDAYSQGVLVQDIEVAYERLAAGEPPALPRPTATMRAWTEALARIAESPDLDAERGHWLRTLGDGVPTIPLDFPDGRNDSEAVRSVAVGLSRERTRRLFLATHRSGRRGTLNVLLTAIAGACARWAGGPELALRLLTHGRDSDMHGLCMRRTVACATYAFPVRLAVRAHDVAGLSEAVGAALAAVPRRGLGYTLLRHVREDPRVAALPEPAISVNYRARLAPAGRSFLGTRVPSLSGVRLDPGAERSMILEVDIVVEGGELRTRWLYCANLHREETIAAVASDSLATLNALLEEG